MPVPWKALAVCAAVLLLALHSLPRPNRTPRLLASPSAIPPTVSQALGAAAPAPPSQRPQPPAALDRVPLRPPVAAPRAPATHHHRPQALRPVPTPRSRAHWGLWLAAAAVGAVCLAARATRRAPAPRSAGRWAAVAMAADTPWPTHDDRQRFFEGNDAAYGRGPFRGDGEAVRYGEPRYEDRHGGAPSWEAAGKEEEENFAMKTRFVNRKDMYGAPYHQRRLLMSSPLSREMREKYGVRTMPVRKGDIVRVRLGKFAGIEGMVTRTYHEKLLVPPSRAPARAAPPRPMGRFVCNGHRTSVLFTAVSRYRQSKDQGCSRREGTSEAAQRRLERRLEEVAKAVGGGCCRLQMPLKLRLAVRGTVAGHRGRPVRCAKTRLFWARFP